MPLIQIKSPIKVRTGQELRIPFSITDDAPLVKWHILPYLTPAPIDPGSLAGLSMWLSADAGVYQDVGGTIPAANDGDPVALWQGYGGTSNHAIQADDLKRPIIKHGVLGGKPVIRFGGAHDMAYQTSINTQDSTVFVVSRSVNNGVQQYVLNDTVASTNRLHICYDSDRRIISRVYRGSYYGGYSSCENNDDFSVVCVRVSGSESVVTLFADGRQGSREAVATFAYGAAIRLIGSKNSNYLTGDIAEIIAYDRKLSDSERAGVEGYLFGKYGIRREVVRNPLIPLVTPTPDGTGIATHPDVYYSAEGWNGYKYWMAFTPYSNLSQENPSILASNDGDTWVVPDGLTNPVVPLPASGYNSDPCLVMDDGVMHLFWREYAPGSETIYLKTSENGTVWSAASPVLVGSGDDIMSPSILFDGSRYVMWSVANGVGIHRRTSSVLGSGWSEPTLCAVTGMPDEVVPWHVAVILSGGVYHLFMCEYEGSLHYATSDDGLSFSYVMKVISPTRRGWDSKKIYRATAVKSTGGFDLWYGAQALSGTWRIGRMTLDL